LGAPAAHADRTMKKIVDVLVRLGGSLRITGGVKNHARGSRPISRGGTNPLPFTLPTGDDPRLQALLAPPQLEHLVGQNHLRIVPSAVNHAQFAISRGRNREIHGVSLEKRGDASGRRRDRSDRRGVCIIILTLGIVLLVVLAVISRMLI
jgi:hypothetical protein